ASGGLAYGGVKASTNVNVDVAGSCPAVNAFCSIGSLSGTRVGWTLGGGVESIIAGNWTARIDYLYFDLGRESYPIVSTVTFGPGGTEVMRADAKFSGHIVRAGLNYRF
ncbi:MAG TPA: outer membrane beta-barrel protein, partial [Pseudolabrys sp.]|nr:outer membrane beta-barrel protein [Pseudolabrys sp.]